jgi:predicted transport protein
VIAWLAADYGLGRGHAMAIVAVLKDALPTDAQVDNVFRGARRVWRPSYDQLWDHVQTLGSDTGTQPTKQYVSFTRDGRKFTIVQPTGSRLDIGLKLNPEHDPEHDWSGLEPAGTWNSMVTHRAKINDDTEIDDRLLGLIGEAYRQAGR